MMLDAVQLDPFRGMGAQRNCAETLQSGHTPRSGPESSMEEVVPNMLCWRTFTANLAVCCMVKLVCVIKLF